MTKPIQRLKAGPCSASIFANEIVDGQNRTTFYSVSLQRTYRDKEGEYRHTTSFRTEDLPKAALLLCRAYAVLMDVEQNKARSPSGSD